MRRKGIPRSASTYRYERRELAKQMKRLAKRMGKPSTSQALRLPEGVIAVNMDNPEVLHNTIAEAVGEAPLPPKPAPSIRRRV